ncbi:hypothetical protein CRG98_005140 [Punica granatum]|uniref:Uncharacterized protein n=1 Tax=Punica granatum TaxID=22663 RepID=A0A2I0L169_PUNGR|nr:hypothetical protein CRG98_005140 [Punica granatum]
MPLEHCDQNGVLPYLWPNPLSEHPTKEGQAFSTPFWSTKQARLNNRRQCYDLSVDAEEGSTEQENHYCAHPNFNIIGVRIRVPTQCDLGGSTIPGMRKGHMKLYGPECGLSSGPASRAFGSRGLGVSTFPWGRMTDTRERRSRHLSFYDSEVEGG